MGSVMAGRLTLPFLCPLAFPVQSVIIIENFESLQGGVQVPTGGKAHEPPYEVDLVKFQSRRYSPDERRVETAFGIHLPGRKEGGFFAY